MKLKNVLIVFLLHIVSLNAYEVSNKFLGLHGISNNKAHLEIESSFDLYGCPIAVDVRNINKIRFHNSCKFINNKYKGSLVCTEKSTRCIKKSRIKQLILEQLNTFGTWYVTKVTSHDTLSVRSGAGVKYKKVYNLAYRAKNMKVLAIKMNGSTTWYKIKYKNIIGWVSSKYLNCKER